MVPKKAKQSNMFLKWHQNMTLDHEFPSTHKVMHAKFDVNLSFLFFFLVLLMKEINPKIECISNAGAMPKKLLGLI